MDEKENKSHGRGEGRLAPTSPGWRALCTSTCTHWLGEHGRARTVAQRDHSQERSCSDSPCIED